MAQRDRLIALFVADVLRFELEALDGRANVERSLAPERRVAVKRCRLGVRAGLPALRRMPGDRRP